MYTGFKPKIDIKLQLSIIFTPKIFEAQIFTEYYHHLCAYYVIFSAKFNQF